MRNIEAHTHVRGESVYVDDIPLLAGTLHGVIFASPHAHGKINKLDLRAALTSPGIIRILTATDIPGENQIGGIIPDEPLFAENEVHFQGQPVALVLAETVELARAAVSKIKIDITLLPIITEPRDAHAKKQYIVPPRRFTCGDIENQWDVCEHIFSGQVKLGGQEHLYIETQGAYAYLQENDWVKIHTSTQGPTNVQRAVACVLGIGMHQIEVDVTRLGGGFGGKEDQATPWAVMAALGAKLLKRPVKIILHRLDDMRMTGKRHPYDADFKIGLNKDLKILCYEVDFFQNAGAAADLSPPVLGRTLFHSVNSYFIPHVKATAYSCRTNLPPNTAFRGFGGPQGMYVIETAIHRAADEIGVSAMQVQQVNLLQEGDNFPYGQQTENCHARACWQRLTEKYNLKKMQIEIDQFNAKNSLKKKGLALMPVCFGISFTKAHMNQGRALVHVYTDGSVGIATGAVEMGQGVNIKMLQVAAKCFGLSVADIKIMSTNTTRVANTSPSAASATADLNGRALEKACNAIAERLCHVVREKLDLQEQDEVQLKQAHVWVNDELSDLTWKELVMEGYLKRVSLSEHGHYATPDIHYDENKEHGRPFAYHVYGTAAFEVTVDCLRGTYEFDAVNIVHDGGVSLNLTIDLGQAEGGVVQGMGWMTMEELRYDDHGRLLSNALSTYKIPDIYFAPKQLDVEFLNVPGCDYAIRGSKAIGEPPLMYGIGAYFAIYEAMRAFRKDLKFTEFVAPMTPERVLMSLYKSNEK